MCHCQLVHDNAADLRACVALIDLQLNFVASIGLAPEYCLFGAYVAQLIGAKKGKSA